MPFDSTRPNRAVEQSYVDSALPSQQNSTLEARLQDATQGEHWDVTNGELSPMQKTIAGHQYSLTRGPYVISAFPEPLEAGDEFSFEWFGQSGGDAFDVYGYLLNVAH